MNKEYQAQIITLIAERLEVQDMLSVALLQYIKNYEPVQSLDDEGAFLLSSDIIRYNLSDIVDISINDISRLMIHAGFSIAIDYEDDNQPGWLVKYSR